MSKTQTNPIAFQKNTIKNELPGLSKEKEPLKLTGKHFNGNLNFNKPEFTNNIMKSPKNKPLNFIAQKEESKKTEAAFNHNMESIAQNLAKNKIIPSFLVQKKAGDNIATTPSSNSHLKMNNFLPVNNKNSMLKTNAATGNSNVLFKANNLFNVSKK